MELEQIISIANQVRLEFEQRRVSREELVRTCAKHLPNIDTPLVYLPLHCFPGWACAPATVYLKHRLSTGEIIIGSYGGKYHYFLGIKESKIIVDITADQFGGPKVYVGPLKDPWSTEPVAE